MESSEAIKVIQKLMVNEGVSLVDLAGVVMVIKQLEKELAELRENAIVPKFKVGEVKYFFDGLKVCKAEILHSLLRDPYSCDEYEFDSFDIYYALKFDGKRYVCEENLFASPEEAVASLKPEGAE
jgi:hypothetical protein